MRNVRRPRIGFSNGVVKGTHGSSPLLAMLLLHAKGRSLEMIVGRGIGEMELGERIGVEDDDRPRRRRIDGKKSRALGGELGKMSLHAAVTQIHRRGERTESDVNRGEIY